MKRVLIVQVEPLSEQRWSKIERSLWSRLEREPPRADTEPSPSRWRTHARAGLLAAAAACALGVALLIGRVPGEQVLVEQPSRITTGATPSHLALPGLSLSVEPQSAVVVGADTTQGLLIVMDRGSVVYQVASRSSDSPLIVQAGDARVRVLGTRFRVTRLEESARVEVQQGVVEVSARGRVVQVRAGETWAPEAMEPAPVVPVPSVEPPSRENESHDGAASANRATPASVRARNAPAPAPAARAPETPATSSSAKQAVPSRQAVFEQATVLERSEPQRAAELYRSIDSGSDSWAQNALYARGRLEASLGNRAEARRLLQRYLERFPRGHNADDARAVLKRLR
jgi:hypothetical protein